MLPRRRAYNPDVTRWQLFLDADTVPDARDQAWPSLRARVRQPVLLHLRRRIEGWRLTEELAQDVCERLRKDYEGKGQDAASARLRDCLAREVEAVCLEHDVSGALDAEFECDWASSLLGAALEEFGRTHPDAYRLFLRLYDGERPLTAAELASKLQQPTDEVERRLAAGRAELRRLFEVEIAHTVADEACLADEVTRLLPRARLLFSD
jgi:DNA-directed RNA polymerase specialized sigma24 family protein